MKIGLYPGCSLKGSSREYRESVIAIAEKAGINLVEVPDWNCCGATAAHNLNKELSLALPLRILAIAEKEGMDELLVPCAACYSRLGITDHELKQDKALKEKVQAHVEMPFEGKVKIINIVQFIEKYLLDKLDETKKEEFKHKVACYYGCLLVRPNKILKFDRTENPQSMDKVMEKIGAEPIQWAYKTECCGAGHSIVRTDIVAKLSGTIVKDAADRGAEAIVVACPMCHSNLDMRRPEINKILGKNYEIPAIYISQAIGIALGIDKNKLGLQRHFTKYNLV
ncbi:MAG: CoB--CoM heterodisulfide reductase iron-sulfur subunit B family protein [Bacteroidales bacterium]